MNQINKLEANVGVKLIEETNQGTQFTAAGCFLYKDEKNHKAVTDPGYQVMR